MLVSGSVSGDQKHGSLQIGPRLGTWTHLFGLEFSIQFFQASQHIQLVAVKTSLNIYNKHSLVDGNQH